MMLHTSHDVPDTFVEPPQEEPPPEPATNAAGQDQNQGAGAPQGQDEGAPLPAVKETPEGEEVVDWAKELEAVSQLQEEERRRAKKDNRSLTRSRSPGYPKAMTCSKQM